MYDQMPQCDVVSAANDMHLCDESCMAWTPPDLAWRSESDKCRSLLEDIIPDLEDEGEEGLGKGKRVWVLQAMRMKMNR